MKRIMTGVILLLAVLVFTICVAQPHFKKPKKVKQGQTFKIEYTEPDGTEQVVVEFGIQGYDDQDNPIIVKLKPDGTIHPNQAWGERAYELPAGAEEIISIHHVNPPCVRVNRILRCF
jgi:hypothetical protein